MNEENICREQVDVRAEKEGVQFGSPLRLFTPGSNG